MENYGLRKSIFYCGKKEFEVINTCFQFFGFIRHLIVVYHLQMRVFVFVISYGCYGWQQESHHFFQRYVFYEKKNTKKKTWTRQNFQRHPISNVLLRIAKYTTYSLQVLLLCSNRWYKALTTVSIVGNKMWLLKILSRI